MASTSSTKSTVHNPSYSTGADSSKANYNSFDSPSPPGSKSTRKRIKRRVIDTAKKLKDTIKTMGAADTASEDVSSRGQMTNASYNSKSKWSAAAGNGGSGGGDGGYGSANIPTTYSLNITPSYSSTRRKKRALLCGVSYKGAKYKLEGTINDVKMMRNLLIDKFKYPKEFIRVLTEEETKPEFQPTKGNILSSMEWLVDNCKEGDSLVFYYSGHGLRQPEFYGDELDGFDETICPLDYEEQGMILDDEINSIIVKPLKKGVTLHAIVDASHSGTILDLPFIYNTKEKIWTQNWTQERSPKCTNGGLAICFSACGDHQLATDTSVFDKNKMKGAMTYLLVHYLNKLPGLTYKDYLGLIHDRIEDVNSNNCLRGARFVPRVVSNKSRPIEKPMLSSSEMFDIETKSLIL